MATTLDSVPFDSDAAASAIPDLVHLSVHTEDITKLPEMLAGVGIRLVVEAPLPGSKMDGAAFWLDESHPVVAVSIRYDRNDHFWFTLLHELAHITLGHAKPGEPPKVDDEDDVNRSAEEDEADTEASAWMVKGISDDELPHNLSSIIELAGERRIHAGLIVGRLHHLNDVGGDGIAYNRFRESLVKVRHLFDEHGSRPIGNPS